MIEYLCYFRRWLIIAVRYRILKNERKTDAKCFWMSEYWMWKVIRWSSVSQTDSIWIEIFRLSFLKRWEISKACAFDCCAWLVICIHFQWNFSQRKRNTTELHTRKKVNVRSKKKKLVIPLHPLSAFWEQKKSDFSKTIFSHVSIFPLSIDKSRKNTNWKWWIAKVSSFNSINRK